jgi:hypothetical protein
MALGMVGFNTTLFNIFLANWRTQCEVHLAAVFAPDTSITRYFVADLSVGTTPTLVTGTGGVPGTAGTNSLPGTVAAISTKYTSVKGQHGRGRIYFGPIPDTFTTPATDPNKINGAGTAAYNLLHGDLLTNINAGGQLFALALTTRPNPPQVLVSLGTNVTGIMVQLITGNVRRRREGRGI